MKRSYCVAFNRDRDFYQVPAALAAAGKLRALVTDLYVPDALEGCWLSRKLGLDHRHCETVPSSLVKWSPEALWLQMVALRLASSERQRSEIFHRLDPDAAAGEGLGLTIAQRVLERQGGRIWVEDTPGGGCTFRLALPAVAAASGAS